MDYPHQARLKILGNVEVVSWSEAGEWKNQLPIEPKGRPERAVRIHLAAFDWNCPQHITPRWTLEELQQTDLFKRIHSLEDEVKRLCAELAQARTGATLNP
jgi:uncharacterized small protein (DUF1192 family)